MELAERRLSTVRSALSVQSRSEPNAQSRETAGPDKFPACPARYELTSSTVIGSDQCSAASTTKLRWINARISDTTPRQTLQHSRTVDWTLHYWVVCTLRSLYLLYALAARYWRVNFNILSDSTSDAAASAVSSPSRVWSGFLQPKSNLVYFNLEIWQLVSTILVTFPRLNCPNFVHFKQ